MEAGASTPISRAQRQFGERSYNGRGELRGPVFCREVVQQKMGHIFLGQVPGYSSTSDALAPMVEGNQADTALVEAPRTPHVSQILRRMAHTYLANCL